MSLRRIDFALGELWAALAVLTASALRPATAATIASAAAASSIAATRRAIPIDGYAQLVANYEFLQCGLSAGGKNIMASRDACLRGKMRLV